MKAPRRPTLGSAHTRQAQPSTAPAEATPVDLEIRALNTALQRQISERLTQLEATCCELEDQLAELKRDEAELRRAHAQLERLNARHKLDLSAQDMSELLEALRDDASAALEQLTPATPLPGLRGMQLLVVDDSITNRELAQQLLQSAGAEVTTAKNGEEAIQLLSGRSEPFDAVLMDIQMPVMDGPEATRHIRSVLGQATLPILALSGEASESERQRALDAGMTAFLHKPLDPYALLRALHGSLDAAQQRAALDAENIPIPDSWPRMGGLDRKLSYNSCSGDRDLLVRVLAQLCAELDELQTCDETPAGDARLAARLHKLQGSASTMGAFLVSAAAVQTLAATKLSHEQARFVLRHSLIPEIEKLHSALTPLMASARVDTERDPSLAPTENEVQLLHTLIERLEEQRTDALELFLHIRSALSARLTAEQLRSLQNAIEALEYEHALELLMRYHLIEATTQHA